MTASTRPDAIDLVKLQQLAALAMTIRRDDPGGATTDLREHFADFEHVTTTVPLTERPSVPVWPLTIGQHHRRDAVIYLATLADDLAAVVGLWERLTTLSVGEVPYPVHRLAYLALHPPDVPRHAPPAWLRDLHGRDLQRILGASLAPVLAAMRDPSAPLTPAPAEPAPARRRTPAAR